MKIRNVTTAVVAGLLASIVSQPASAESHYSKTIEMIESTISDCYFFKLVGVAQSDPVTPNSPWFAIHREQTQAKEMLTILMTARTSGMTLQRVMTNGAVVCGHAQVHVIDF